MHGWEYDPFLDFFTLIGRENATTSDRTNASQLTPQKTEWRLRELRHVLAVSKVIDMRLMYAIEAEKRTLRYLERDGSIMSID